MRAVVLLGSNIEPERNLPEAVRRLRMHCRLLAVSPVYRTAPVGRRDQPAFWNAAVLLETDLPPGRFKDEVLRPIEEALKRRRTSDRNAPRTIDLDLVLFGDFVGQVGARRIPDPDLLRYAHVAIPVASVAGAICHPESGQRLAEIAAVMSSDGVELLGMMLELEE